MVTFKAFLINFFSHEDGVTAMEYALLGSLIAVMIIGVVTDVGLNVLALYSYVADQVVTAAAKAL